MKKHKAIKAPTKAVVPHNLLPVLLVLLILGIAGMAYFLNWIGINWLQRPAVNEIYFDKFEGANYVVYSSFAQMCNACGKDMQIEKGLNNISQQTCGKNLQISCAEPSTARPLSLRVTWPEKQENKLSLSMLPQKPWPGWIYAVFALAILLAWKLRHGHWLLSGLQGFAIVAASFMAHYQLMSLFNLPIAPVALAVAVLGLHVKKFSRPAIQLHFNRRWLNLAIGFFAAMMLFAHYGVSKENLWGSYYFRQANEVLQNGGVVFYEDGLSYLGRPFTFPPGYMEVGAGVATLLDKADFSQVAFAFNWLIGIFYLLSLYVLLARFHERQRIFGMLVIVSELFVAVTASAIGLHILAYALMNIGIAMLFFRDRVSTTVSIATLVASFAVHPSAVILAPFYYLLSTNFSLGNWKRPFAAFVAAIVISFAVFFWPIFQRYGMPYEIVPDQWGYLLSFGWIGFLLDFNMLVPLMAGTAVFGFMGGKKEKLLSALLIIAALANIFVSARLNLIVGILLAGLAMNVFEKHLPNNRKFFALLAFPVLALLLFPVIYHGNGQWCSWGSVSEHCLSPLKYIESHTEKNDPIAINPLFGHLAAYIAKRPVLADLYVEYADEQKYNEAWRFHFLREMPKRPEVKTFVLDDLYDSYYNPRLEGLASQDKSETYWIGNAPYQARDLPNADRLYDNGFMHVFRK